MSDDPFFNWHFLVAELVKWGLLTWFGAQAFFACIPEEHGPAATLASMVTGLVAIPLSLWLFPND